MKIFVQKKPAFSQCDSGVWKARWQSLVPEDCRDVPIACGGETYRVSIRMTRFALILQDGLLMEQEFFTRCKLFQEAGYHVVWLMRCTQDIANGYLKPVRCSPDGARCVWDWKSPTTNFGRWSSDNFHVTILIQPKQLPEGDLTASDAGVLQRVIWAESDDAAKMIPGRTRFITSNRPGSPRHLLAWLTGTPLGEL
jgi:hypothetical protein